MLAKSIIGFKFEHQLIEARLTSLIFSEQTIVVCIEIHIDVSYFNQDTKQNSDTCRNVEKPQSV